MQKSLKCVKHPVRTFDYYLERWGTLSDVELEGDVNDDEGRSLCGREVAKLMEWLAETFHPNKNLDITDFFLAHEGEPNFSPPPHRYLMPLSFPATLGLAEHISCL